MEAKSDGQRMRPEPPLLTRRGARRVFNLHVPERSPCHYSVVGLMMRVRDTQAFPHFAALNAGYGAGWRPRHHRISVGIG
jgi:hypothetical protein